MTKLLFILLLCPLLPIAQNYRPRFENDTLYTSGGYTIYKGRVLQLANGTQEAGYFRYIRFHSNMGRNDTYTLQGSSILVRDLKQYKNSSSGNQSIRISGTATRKDNSKLEVDINLEFDMAIMGADGLAAELSVPEEFRTRQVPTVSAEIKKQPVQDETKKQAVPDDLKKLLIADEIKKLFDLYKAGALTKEEYESRKKKLLEQ